MVTGTGSCFGDSSSLNFDHVWHILMTPMIKTIVSFHISIFHLFITVSEGYQQFPLQILISKTFHEGVDHSLILWSQWMCQFKMTEQQDAASLSLPFNLY